MTTECPTCEDCKEENERWCGQCHEELQTARHWLRFPGEMPEQQAAMMQDFAELGSTLIADQADVVKVHDRISAILQAHRGE